MQINRYDSGRKMGGGYMSVYFITLETVHIFYVYFFVCTFCQKLFFSFFNSIIALIIHTPLFVDSRNGETSFLKF